MGRDDDLISRAHTERHQHQLHSFEPVRDADAVPRADAGSVFGFEGLEFFAQQDPARLHDAVISSVEFLAEFFVSGFEVENRNFHPAAVVG